MKIPNLKDLIHKISFLENTAISNLELDNWEMKISVYAGIEALCDSTFHLLEDLNFNHVIIKDLYLFRMRFINSINNQMRIEFKNNIFKIKRIINIYEKNRWLQIIALKI